MTGGANTQGHAPDEEQCETINEGDYCSGFCACDDGTYSCKIECDDGETCQVSAGCDIGCEVSCSGGDTVEDDGY